LNKNYYNEEAIDVFGKAANCNSQQLGSMEKRGGSPFWPKPILHPACPIDANSNIVILVKPYGFCKVWYSYYDIVVTSCKHTYHPFCLAKLFKNENKCYVCG